MANISIGPSKRNFIVFIMPKETFGWADCRSKWPSLPILLRKMVLFF